MNELNFEDSLTVKIKKLSENIWENKVDNVDIDKWLDNFTITNFDTDVDKQRLHALYLLSCFMYFGNREIREMLKSVFRDKVKHPLIKSIRKSNGNSNNSQLINSQYVNSLKKVRFIGVGNPAESGTHLLYYFRQENNLPSKLFINQSEIFNFTNNENGVVGVTIQDMSINRYVFLDDLSGTGTQVIKRTAETIKTIKAQNSEAVIQYVALFATKEAINKIKEKVDFNDVACIFELNDTFKCFSTDSRCFPTTVNPSIDKSYLEKMSRTYGKKISRNHADALGYNDSQLLLGFTHNTPNNTLPIFWSVRKQWQPIFKRYSKLS